MVILPRFIKRFVIFIPALVVSYLVINDIYPALSDRITRLPALLVAYFLGAYLLIPGSIRLVRLVSSPRHVPFYSTTPDGFASDPVQIALFGTREAAIQAMNAIGWEQADKRNLKSLFRLITSMVFKTHYSTAPFSHLYLLGKSQDLGFQLAVKGNSHRRHHVRFWAVKPELAEHFTEDVAFWHGHHPHKNPDNSNFLWLGAASLDTGIGIIRHNAQLTHMIHPDTNAERELIVNSLKKAKLCKRVKRVTIAKPYQLRNRVITGYLEADGELAICQLLDK